MDSSPGTYGLDIDRVELLGDQWIVTNPGALLKNQEQDVSQDDHLWSDTLLQQMWCVRNLGGPNDCGIGDTYYLPGSQPSVLVKGVFYRWIHFFFHHFCEVLVTYKRHITPYILVYILSIFVLIWRGQRFTRKWRKSANKRGKIHPDLTGRWTGTTSLLIKTV